MSARTLHALLSAAAAQRPDAPAVVDGDVGLSYAELDRRADQLARTLRACGVVAGDRVGLYLDKSVDSVIGIYGILKVGAVYVPLDLSAPAARSAWVTVDAGITCLVSAVPALGKVDALQQAGARLRTVVVLSAHDPEVAPGPAGVEVVDGCAVDRFPGTPLEVRRISDDLAYVLYTSGSTGTPKGVMLTHRNALAFVEWAVEATGVRAEDRVSSHAPLHFDLSVFDLFAACAAGACVVLVPTDVAKFPVSVRRLIEEQQITVWYSVPSILTMLALRGGLAPGALPSLRVVLFAGEVFPTKFLRQLMRLLPAATFWNLYGPTETNVCTAYCVPELGEDDVTPIPIGAAVSDDETFVVTDDGRLASPGEVGVLHVRGASVMPGYWNDPDRTARVLQPSAWHAGTGAIAYRTGDLVRELPSGDYEFLGRVDDQVKSRGYRIELGDIEAALQAHPEVVEAAAVAVADELVGSRIVAYATADRALDSRELLRFCRQRLPGYMVPERVDVVDDLPKTSTGKLDRQSLARVSAAQQP